MTAPRRTRIKFCGMTSAHDVRTAVAAGADAVGVILAESPRRVAFRELPALRAAVPPFVSAVAVVARESAQFARELAALGFMLQFSGPEPADVCERLTSGAPYLKAFAMNAGERYAASGFASLRAYANAMWMFDSGTALQDGGTGLTFDWSEIAPLARERPVVVSGGLTAQNVAACVRSVRPYAVDARSGVETGGHKDPAKMDAFVRAVREADAQT